MKTESSATSSQEKYVFVMPKSIFCSEESPEQKQSIVSLPNPRTNKSSKFLINEQESKCQIFEINRHLENPSSWFIDNHVKSDGSLYIATPYDSLYILLSRLYNSESKKFLLINQLFSDCECPANTGTLLLNSLKDKSQMNNIADNAGSDDFIAYRYSEERTLSWLKRKVEKTAAAVKESEMFIEPTENSTEEDLRLRYACGLVSEYLPSPLHRKLLKHLGLPEKSEKRKSVGPCSEAKKIKTEAIEDYSKIAIKSVKTTEKKSQTRTQKALDKVDKRGMKTMSSFFASKPKK